MFLAHHLRTSVFDCINALMEIGHVGKQTRTRAPHAGADAHLIFTSIMGHYFIARNTSNDEIQDFCLS